MTKRKTNKRVVIVGDAIMLLVILGGGYAFCVLVGALLRALGVG